MRKALYAVILFALAGLLYGADPGVGTWKLNSAKSKFPPGQPPPKDLINVVRQQGDQVEVNVKGTQADGSSFSYKYTFPMGGGIAKYSEGEPAGTTLTVSKLVKNARDFTVKRDGKEVQVQHVVVQNKTMTLTGKGVDPQGKPFEFVTVLDMQ